MGINKYGILNLANTMKISTAIGQLRSASREHNLLFKATFHGKEINSNMTVNEAYKVVYGMSVNYIDRIEPKFGDTLETLSKRLIEEEDLRGCEVVAEFNGRTISSHKEQIGGLNGANKGKENISNRVEYFRQAKDIIDRRLLVNWCNEVMDTTSGISDYEIEKCLEIIKCLDIEKESVKCAKALLDIDTKINDEDTYNKVCRLVSYFGRRGLEFKRFVEDHPGKYIYVDIAYSEIPLIHLLHKLIYLRYNYSRELTTITDNGILITSDMNIVEALRL